MCGDSTVAVCSGEPGEKWLKTQYINKSLPAPDEYSVRVFVNITYTLTCPGMGSGVGPRMMMMCEREFELLIAHSKTGDYTGDNIMPTNRIEHSQDTINSITKQFYFDVSEEEDGFFLALKRSHKDVCINVSRVLVYRHECPGHEKLSVGLIRYPATQAPVNGTVSAMPYCAENSNHSKGSIPDRLVCTAEGEWMNDGTECECDMGYSRKGDKCEGIWQLIICGIVKVRTYKQLTLMQVFSLQPLPHPLTHSLIVVRYRYLSVLPLVHLLTQSLVVVV